MSDPRFNIVRIYLKDLSFESPKAPEIFDAGFQPKLGLEMDSTSRQIKEGLYEVVLKMTVTVKNEEDVAFLAEIEQAGAFVAENIEPEQLERILGAVCPNILYPYAREAIDSVALKGTFPAPMLAPINFDAWYDQKVAAAAEAASATKN
ncbi:protein-export chaperone SecB [Litorivicinus lipolyticus]|uniref:Protein-export protein SecB n=1 Tax=Litorivicinus lipolyticus TaxID=418701 RepID=A0A5Q2QFU2_9GAMM|nr:protein-export chaperone SecB [Litorivicinus lipolyticus]QGG81222.1 protein-export chaperone SecB [Litorivicinus lipolyticus]